MGDFIFGTEVPSITPSSRPSMLSAESAACQWQGDGSRASWDGLRRDNELWVPSGDCLVYLYDENQSQRGPSIRVPYKALADAQCTSLTAFASSANSEPQGTGTGLKKLYLGAPADLSREEAFNWHVTTRNFFAWLLHRPLVGERLSRAMNDLLARMTIYRESSADNVADLLDYADRIGYSNFAGQPDLALAMLSFADEYKLRDIWIDAFVHCVGMRESLSQSHEYEVTRNVNKALITRAALRMDLSLERATGAVDTLLEEDLSPSNLALNAGSRRHLDHFRTFLQSHLVGTYGYWPVRETSFVKSLYSSMQVEFENLYEYLADKNFTRVDDTSNTPDNFNVGRTIQAFDDRHNFDPLPYTSSLLPDVSTGAGHRTQAHWALRSWKIGKDHKQSADEIVRNAYIEATNSTDPQVLNSPLVQAYAAFESDLAKSFDDKISFGEARDIRWIVVYEMLQILISINSAPEEVRDTQSASYPLCCSVSGIPPWSMSTESTKVINREQPHISRHSASSSTFSGTADEPWGANPARNTDYNSSSRKKDFTNENNNPDSSSSLGHVIPAKSQRRSLVVGRSLSNVSKNSNRRGPTIPDRHSSHEAFPSLDTIRSRVSSDTIPSLNWSRSSAKSISSSEGPLSPASRSSSIYSEKSSSFDNIKSDEQSTPDFFSEDGGFVCPGLIY